MPIAKTWSVALLGIDGRLIEIEADLGGGLSKVTLVGLPDAGLREAKDRVRSAIRNSGEPWPDGKVTLGLSPANLPKVGSGYDLGIAAAVLAALGAVPATRLLRTVLLGELASTAASARSAASCPGCWRPARRATPGPSSRRSRWSKPRSWMGSRSRARPGCGTSWRG